MNKDIKAGKIPNWTIEKTTDPKNPGLTIGTVTTDTKITFQTMTSGEGKDQAVTVAALGGSIGFGSSVFASTDANGASSVFTGGIITDLGTLSYTISASSLPSLDGTTITQALFNDLNPLAAKYGVNIANNGDYLDFSFDPADTINGGGV